MHPALEPPLTEGNVNLYAGLAMLIFGEILLLLAQRARPAGVGPGDGREDD